MFLDDTFVLKYFMKYETLSRNTFKNREVIYKIESKIVLNKKIQKNKLKQKPEKSRDLSHQIDY